MDITKTRDATFDLAKAAAMFMVVCSHVIFYRQGFNLVDMPSHLMNFIQVVNMPLFFMISGYFSRRLHEEGNWSKLLNRVITYFWPMAIFAVIFKCISSLGFGEFPASELPIAILKCFLFQGWFFQALAICDGITFLACRWHRKWQVTVVCMVGYAICLVGSGRMWYVGNVVPMIPFYWFGLVLLPVILQSGRMFSLLAYLGVAALIFVTWFYGNIATNGLAFYWDKFDVLHPEAAKATNMLLRLVVGSFGALGILWHVRMAVSKFSYLEKLGCFGEETLGVYFLQGWLIVHFVTPFVGLEATAPVLLLASCGIYLAAFCIVKLLKANELIRKVVFGWRV